MATTTTSFTPLKDHIFVTDIEQGNQKTKGGIILRDDNFKDHGIKPRWCKIWAIGPDVDNVSVGEWLYVEHGRWTLRIPLALPDGTVDVWRIDPQAIILCSSDPESPALSRAFK